MLYGEVGVRLLVLLVLALLTGGAPTAIGAISERQTSDLCATNKTSISRKVRP
jgi:hypothetical protein